MPNYQDSKYDQFIKRTPGYESYTPGLTLYDSESGAGAKSSSEKDGDSPWFNGEITGGSLHIGAKDTKATFIDNIGRLWIGANEFADAPFSVTETGVVNMSSVTISGYLADGEAAADVNAGTTKITGTQIVTGSITATQIETNTLTVGTNVQIGTAEDASGVTSIIGSTITTGYVNALGVTADSLSGGTIDIGGADTSSFHVNSAGDMWLGAAAYADGPFRVSKAGALTATSATITGNISGSTITGSTLQTGTSGENTNITSSIITVRNNTTVTGTFRGYSGGGSYLNVDNAVVDSRITAAQVDTPEVVNYGASLTLETDGTHHIIISPSVDETDYIDRIVDVKGLVKILSTGDDKNLSLYHNDISGYISTSSGNLYLNAQTGRVGNMSVLFFYAPSGGGLVMTANSQIQFWTNGTTWRFYAYMAGSARELHAY